MNELNKIHRVIDREYPEAIRKHTCSRCNNWTNAIKLPKNLGDTANTDSVILTKWMVITKVVLSLQFNLKWKFLLLNWYWRTNR